MGFNMNFKKMLLVLGATISVAAAMDVNKLPRSSCLRSDPRAYAPWYETQLRNEMNNLPRMSPLEMVQRYKEQNPQKKCPLVKHIMNYGYNKFLTLKGKRV